MSKLIKLYFYNVHSAAAAAKSLQSCMTLCDPIDGSPPGSSVPGILQARTLEWVAMCILLHVISVELIKEVKNEKRNKQGRKET